MICDVHSLVGDYGVTMEDGQKLFDRISPEIRAGHKVELDFDGVRILASPFLNAGIGQLLQEVSSQALHDNLKWSNLSSVGRNVLERVLENSTQLSHDPNTRTALDEMLSDVEDD